MHRDGGQALRLPDDAVEGLALAAALRRDEGMRANIALHALGRLLEALEVAVHPIADFRPGVRCRFAVLPDRAGDDVALLASEGCVAQEALLALEQRDESLLHL